MEVCLVDGHVAARQLQSYRSDSEVSNMQPTARPGWNDPYSFMLFGRTGADQSVTLIVTDAVVRAYALLNDFQSRDPEVTLTELRRQLPSNHQIATRVLERKCAFGFQGTVEGTALRWFIEFTFASPGALRQTSSVLYNAGWTLCAWHTFKAQDKRPGAEQPTLCQQILQQLPGAPENHESATWFSWVTVGAGAEIRGPGAFKTTHSHFEVRARLADLHVLPETGRLPCMVRTVSFDIECANLLNNDFPVASLNPVVCVGNSVCDQDPKGGCVYGQQIVFAYTVRPGAPPVEVRLGCPMPESEKTFELRIFSSEVASLEAWRDWLIESDLDIMLGYNTFLFDNPYLVQRMRLLAPGSRFFRMGRMRAGFVRGDKADLSSNAMGNNDVTTFDVPGWTEIDGYLVAKKLFTRYSSYKLGDIAAHDLKGLTKLDLPAAQINVAFRAGDDERIAAYCVRDTELPLLLLEKWGSIPQFMAVSRLTFCTMRVLAVTGQKTQVDAMTRNGYHTLGYINNPLKIPTTDYTGATVVKPVPGFHTRPIVTVDYMSLYPTMIVHHNLCMSTLVHDPKVLAQLPPSAYHTIETSPTTRWHFVKEATSHGILPYVMRETLAARGRVKKMMGDAIRAKQPGYIVKALDWRQLALKIVANSLYGVLSMVCFPVADATTACGRMALQAARSIAEAPPFYCNVIYGDTDSIMVDFCPPGRVEPLTLAEARTEGDQLADAITAHFVAENPASPVVMENEKTYCPYLLAKKKRYCGMKYEGSKPPVMDVKGFDLVRRSTLPYLKKLFQRIFDLLMECSLPRDVPAHYQRTLAIIRDVFEMLAAQKVPLADLVSSASLMRNYANPEAIIQWKVNQTIARVRPGTEFAPGNRVPFLILHAVAHFAQTAQGLEVSLRGASTTKVAERAVFSEYCTEWPVLGAAVDWTYYLERSRAPILQVLRLIAPESASEDFDQLYQPIAECIRSNTPSYATFAHKDIRLFFQDRGVETPLRIGVHETGEKRPLVLPKLPEVTLKKPRVGTLTEFFGRRSDPLASLLPEGPVPLMSPPRPAVPMEIVPAASTAPRPAPAAPAKAKAHAAPRPASAKAKVSAAPAKAKVSAAPPPRQEGSMLAFFRKK